VHEAVPGGGGRAAQMEAAAEMEDFDEAECLSWKAEAADREVEHLCALHGISPTRGAPGPAP